MKYVLIVLLLAGCAMTPTELRQWGKLFVHSLKSAPREAAQCVARNAEDFRVGLSDPVTARVREHKDGIYEVVVTGLFNHNFAFAQVFEHGGGTRMNVWMSPHYMLADRLRAAMAAGC